MDLGLTDKTALVTGANRGTGEIIARTLAAEGASVLVHGPADGDAAPVVADIVASGGRAEACCGDLTLPDGAAALVDRVLAAGGADIVVANFGAATAGSWATSGDDEWIDAYERNVLCGVRVVRGLLDDLRARGWGRIVFLGTVGIARPSERMPHYYAAKAALPAVALGLAKELAGSGVTVNTVSPGIVRTAEVDAWVASLAERHGWSGSDDEVEAAAARRLMPNPAGRLGRREEVAAAVAFLASDAASYINAVNLRVDGGSADTVP